MAANRNPQSRPLRGSRLANRRDRLGPGFCTFGEPTVGFILRLLTRGLI